MKITKEQKEALLDEWRMIGENDCSPPSDELDKLLRKILDFVTD